MPQPPTIYFFLAVAEERFKGFLRRVRPHFALPMLSSVLLILALPQYGVWPVIWVAMVPYLFFVTEPGQTFRRALAGTFVALAPCALAVVFPLFGLKSAFWSGLVGSLAFGYLRHIFVFIVLALIAGTIGLLITLPVVVAIRRNDGSAMSTISIALAWTLAEWIRSQFFLFGYSWGALGYALIDMPFFRYAAALPGGVLLLTFIAVLGNIAVLELLRGPLTFSNKKNGDSQFECRGRNMWVDHPQTCVFIVVVVVLSLAGYAHARERICAAPSIQVSVVSSDLETQQSLGPDAYAYYRARVERALASGSEFVLLPENALPIFELDENTWRPSAQSKYVIPSSEELLDDLLSLSRTFSSAEIAIGLHTYRGGKEYNSLVTFQDGAVISVSHKLHPVPFAEYPAAGDLLPIYERIERGTGAQFSLVHGAHSNVLTCSEAGNFLFDRQRTTIILSPSNDSVFSSSEIARMQHSFARMRALEESAYLLRSSKGGISSIIAPDGSVVTEGSRGEILTANVPICQEIEPQSRD